MNLMDLAVSVTVDDKASKGISELGSKIKGGLATAAKVGAAAVAAIGTAAVAGAKMSIDAYADYEQLVGGIEKLFGDAQTVVAANAAEAYKTAGLSANKYMELTTNYAAALKQSLGGDTVEAANYADLAIRSIADNVNVFGSDMQSVQDAFNGFAKQNYTMLDNLKLGYGGTKQEMQRLIDDANKLPGVMKEGNDLSIESYADVIEAIARVQQEQNIAGTTAKEAASTISGSIAMMQASWENWLVALADPEVDLNEATKNLLDSVVTVISNIGPRVVEVARSVFTELPNVIAETVASTNLGVPQNVLDMFQHVADRAAEMGDKIKGAWASLGEAFQPILDRMPTFEEAIDGLMGYFDMLADNFGMVIDAIRSQIESDWFQAAVAEVTAGIDTIKQNFEPFYNNFLKPLLDTVMPALGNIIGTVIGVAVSLLGGLLQLIGDLMGFLGGIGPALEEAGGWFDSVGQDIQTLWQGVVDFFLGIPAHLQEFANGVGSVFSSMGDAVGGVMNGIQSTVGSIWDAIVGAVVSTVETIKFRVQSGFDLMKSIVSSIFNSIRSTIANVWNSISSTVASVVNNIKSTVSNVFNSVKSTVTSVWNGIKSAITTPINAAKDAVSNAINRIRDIISNVKLQLPRIALPHFRVNGGEFPYGIGGQGRAPEFGVDWYAKGGIFDKPSVIGVGEAGDEAVLPIKKLQPMIAEAMEGQMVGQDAIIEWLDRNLGPIIQKYAPTATPRQMARMVGGY